jgi:hypothetical protein
MPANYVNGTCEMPHKSRKNNIFLRRNSLTCDSGWTTTLAIRGYFILGPLNKV